MTGPLAGLRVVELAGLGTVPHAGMLLAAYGADVVQVCRPGPALEIVPVEQDPTQDGRRRAVADLRTDAGRDLVLRLASAADVLIEGFRPGVAERLGVGPGECMARNPRLVYGRVTGWGQTGPRADEVGHDLNYIGLTGALHAIGRAGQAPVPPLNLVGDYGGGSMLLVVGVLVALQERQRSGLGQVVDAAMVDGVAQLQQMTWGLWSAGIWSDSRGENLLDGGAPFYDVYPCADGRYVAVGALEPQFYAALLAGLELDPDEVPDRGDRDAWPALRDCLARRLATRTRDEWAEVFAGTQGCVTPVLSLAEAGEDPHLAARGTLIHGEAGTRAAPAPRFSRTPARPPAPSTAQDRTAEILRDWYGPEARP